LDRINIVKRSVHLKVKDVSGLKSNLDFPLFLKGWREAFTLIELLVVIAIIAILAAVLLPVLNQAKARGQAADCIANQSQLAKAWLMYATDNNDGCPGNWWQHEQTWKTYPHENWVAGWVGVADTGGDGTSGNVGGPDNTNALLLVDSKYSTLGDYTKNPPLYLCPASQVRGSTVSGGPKTRVICRTVSMNCWMGYNTPVQSYFGDGANYKVFKKVTDITAGIGPADAFVFMEERAESIDDGWFAVDGPRSLLNIVNWPTDYHNEGATVGFADGHVEIHRWQNAKFSSVNPANANFLVPQDPSPIGKWGGGTAAPLFSGGLPWMMQHATCVGH
jgi:prepilin-type N-terminal cleavage/methylation domain-containing protein/prepilin-type processing-associated H-X9-DG protein